MTSDLNDPFIHATAVVESGASIGPGTRIWHQAHVRDGAKIGSGCTLGKNVFVDSGVVIGSDCKIQNNVSLYSGVTLENNVFVGPGAAFTNDLYPRADGRDWKVIETLVENGASIGANATIVCGHTLAARCMIAAGAVVTTNVEPNELVGGNPARRLGWVCECGRVAARTADRPPEILCDECRQ